MENTTTPMENANPPRSQMSAVLRYSIFSGIASVIYYLLLYVFKLNHNQGMAWISLLILAVMMFLCVRDYRDKDLGGFITYGKSFSTGLLIAFFTGIIYTIFFIIFISFIDTTYFTDSIRMAEEQMEARGNLSQEQIDMAINMTKKFMNPLFFAITSVLFYAFFGLIIALIESAILKKDNPEMPQA